MNLNLQKAIIVVQNFGRLSWVFSAAVKMLFQSNEPLIETLYLLFFNFKVGTKKFVGQGWEGLQNFVRIMEGAVLFSTRCMNIMLLKMFNWYIFKIFCSLKISLVCTNLFLLKIIRIACFCQLLIFLRFVLQVLPQAILAWFMQVCICEQQRASKVQLKTSSYSW